MFKVLTTVLLCASAAVAQISPFDDLRWVEAKPQVLVDDTWYELLAMEGYGIDEILTASVREYDDKWDKRFCEDLVPLFRTLGHELGDTAVLRVRDLQSGEESTLENVAMTTDKRQRLWRREPRSFRRPNTPPPRIAERAHAAATDPRFADWLPAYGGGAKLTGAQAAHDLDRLEWLLENAFSYFDCPPLGTPKFDHRAALDTIRVQAASGAHVQDIHIALRRVVAAFGDAHSRVRGVHSELPGGYTPLAFSTLDREQILALRPDGDWLDASRPVVAAIDGVAMDRWVDAAFTLAAKGSPQQRHRDALSFLGFVNYLRDELDLVRSGDVRVTLTDLHGENETDVALPLDRRPQFFERAVAPQVPDDIGYVRIPTMQLTRPQVDALRHQVLEQIDRTGMILDVRGNGGGSRDALRALLPIFIPREQGPTVVNVASYRLPPGTTPKTEGHLADRALHPLTASRWSDAERHAVQEFLATFEPEWTPDRERFSDWHCMVVSPAADRAEHFDGPVVLLIDEGCFSATDVFVGAFEILPDVTTVGTATSGGSGRAQEYRLPESQLRVRLSSMASFRPNGMRYDGRGIAPDVEVVPTLSDLEGTSDRQFDRAVQIIRSKR